MRKCQLFNNISNISSFRLIGFQKLLTRRYIIKNVANQKSGSVRSTNLFE